MKIAIKRGLDLRLQGAVATPCEPKTVFPARIALCPDDYEGFVPKTDVRVGDEVCAGDALLHHKGDERIKLVSPVSGKVVGIERGERRHIDRIVVECVAWQDNKQKKFERAGDGATAQQRMELLGESGILALMRRRPYDDVPKADVAPRDIFVTAFDSAPLACNREWSDEDLATLAEGVKFLKGITTGEVYVCRRASTLADLEGAVNVDVTGPHPAGLAGIQAANIRPVNAGETIWTMDIETLWRVGVLATKGVYDGTTFVAVCGSCVEHPYIAKTVLGAEIEPLLSGRLKETERHVRIIAGNVLSGVKTEMSGYLHYPYRQVTVIPEGDDVDRFMGWASMSPGLMSASRTFPGHYFLRRLFNPDARVNGGRRAMIVSGEYDRVVPMDILTEYLIKAINARDIEQMERLGIYEVGADDFALAEYVDSSKLPIRQIVREGLDYLRKELE